MLGGVISAGGNYENLRVAVEECKKMLDEAEGTES